MSDVRKYESEVGLMKESGIGQYVKLYDYRSLEKDRQILLEALERECTCADQNGDEIEKCNACKALAQVSK